MNSRAAGLRRAIAWRVAPASPAAGSPSSAAHRAVSTASSGFPAPAAVESPITTVLAVAAERLDAIGFVHANWSLHARIAAVSPHAMLRSLYVNLLDQIESHTLAVLPYGEGPLPDYMADRHALHTAIIDAIEHRDRDRALTLIAQHNTSGAQPAALIPARPTSHS